MELPDQVEASQMLNVRQVAERTQLSVRTVWRWSRWRQGFPRPRRHLGRRTVWVAKEVEAYLRSLRD